MKLLIENIISINENNYLETPGFSDRVMSSSNVNWMNDLHFKVSFIDKYLIFPPFYI